MKWLHLLLCKCDTIAPQFWELKARSRSGVQCWSNDDREKCTAQTDGMLSIHDVPE